MNIIFGVFGIGMILDIIFIVAIYHKKYKETLFFKVVSSLFFVILGILCTLQYHNVFGSWLIVCGLLLGVLGDFFLDAEPVFPSLKKNAFILGCGSFLIGHLFYITRSLLTIIAYQNWIVILYAVLGCVIGGVIVKLMYKVCSPPKDTATTGILYLLVLDFSCCLAVGLWSAGQLSIWMAIGTFLFAISDHMLVYDYFGNKKIIWFHAVLLVIYYLAQCFIAFSIIS